MSEKIFVSPKKRGRPRKESCEKNGCKVVNNDNIWEDLEILESNDDEELSPTKIPERNYIFDEEEVAEDSAKSDEESEVKDNFSEMQYNWKKCQRFQVWPRPLEFKGNPGTTFDSNTEPFEIFSYFVDNDVFETLKNETNVYANYFIKDKISKLPIRARPSSRLTHWKPVSQLDIKKYIGLIIFMGIHRLPDFKLHWSKNFIYQTSASKIMSLERFQEIQKFIQIPNWEKSIFAHTDESQRKVEYRIDFLRGIVKKFAKVYTPTQNLSLDEAMCRVKGKKTYCPLKPTKWGLKFFVLAESLTGYVLDVKVRLGVQSVKEMDKLVLEMVEPYTYTNSCLFCGSLYTHPILGEQLWNMGIGLTGTLSSKRKDSPIDIKEVCLMKNETLFYKKGVCGVMSMRDKKVFHILTTFDEFNEVMLKNRKKECCAIKNFNRAMRGIDVLNQYISHYEFSFRNTKWWRYVFFRIFEICLVNSFVIYSKILGNKMSFRDFKSTICLKLIGDLICCNIENIKNNETTFFDEHFPEKLTNIHPKPCRVCNFNNKITKSTYRCKKCTKLFNKEIVICVLCFEIFHKNINQYMQRKKKHSNGSVCEEQKSEEGSVYKKAHLDCVSEMAKD